jgi:hypothetical protein
MQTITTIGLDIAKTSIGWFFRREKCSAMSPVGTFRTSRDVQPESGIRTKADVRYLCGPRPALAER